MTSRKFGYACEFFCGAMLVLLSLRNNISLWNMWSGIVIGLAVMGFGFAGMGKDQ